VAALEELAGSEGYAVWQEMVERMAATRALGMLKATTVEDANFERGILFAYRELFDVADRVLTTARRYDERPGGDDSAPDTDPARFWGSPHFHTQWSP